MTISELIKELERQKELHGDVEVEIFASTDCGYSGGGGKIEEITFKRNDNKLKFINGKVINTIYDHITLENNEG